MKAFVEITQSNRATYRQPLAESRISLGRSEHCDISFPAEPELETEHLFIVPGEAGCQVELSRQTRTPFFYRGEPLRNETIPWGEDIFVSTIRLRMVRELSKVDRTKFSPRFILIALLLLGSSAGLLLRRSPTDDSHDSGEVAASPLFEQPIKCSQSSSSLFRARESERAAFAKMERYPFDHQDGIEAVRLLSEARDCYQTAGEIVQETRVQKALNTWMRRLEQDYRSHRLRLRLALAAARYDKAKRTLRILQNLLSHRDDSYTEWLDHVERELNTH